MRIRAYGSIHTTLSTHTCQRPRLHYIFTMHALHFALCIYTHLQLDTEHATRNGNDNWIFLLCQSDIGTDAGIILMNGAQDCGLLRARGQRFDSVLFSQSDNRHITASTWAVPSSFTASFLPHFTCFACI
jgi:hypothetical protein